MTFSFVAAENRGWLSTWPPPTFSSQGNLMREIKPRDEHHDRRHEDEGDDGPLLLFLASLLAGLHVRPAALEGVQKHGAFFVCEFFCHGWIPLAGWLLIRRTSAFHDLSFACPSMGVKLFLKNVYFCLERNIYLKSQNTIKKENHEKSRT